jgi:hypothetical protein
MRRSMVLAVIGMALCIVALAPSLASAAQFTQCPPVDKDTGCQFLLVVSSGGVTVGTDASQGPYDGEDDTLVGIENTSSSPIPSFPLSSAKNIFGFDGDGMCDPPAPPRAPHCIVLAKNSEGNVPTKIKPGKECEHEPAEPEAQEGEEPCGFEPAGEPAGLTSFGNGAALVGFTADGDAVSGYEGPRVWFSGINLEGTSGTVNFSPALAPGEHTYFALEEALFENGLTIGNPTTVATTLSGGGQSGGSISVVQGTAVTDTASLSGASATVATGTVTYTVYSNPECTTVATAAGSASVSGLTAGASSAISTLAPGKYYWKASYSGDVNNQAASSTCGGSGEVLTVLAPTTTTTVQSAGGVSGASLTVPQGTPVSDQAHIAGALAPSATGTVTYTLYKDSKCTVPEAASSSVSVVAGAAGPSAAIKPKVGTYYWQASYSGDGANAASTSACGSEVLVVALQANVGLPSTKICLSRRKFTAHPRAPHGVKLVSVQIFINGVLKAQGKLSHDRTTISLVGLPKGTFHVAMVVKSSTGKQYEDVRTYHTCVPKKHHKK